MYLIGQRCTLPDDITLHCSKSRARFKFVAGRPCVVLLVPRVLAPALRQTGSIRMHEGTTFCQEGFKSI